MVLDWFSVESSGEQFLKAPVNNAAGWKQTVCIQCAALGSDGEIAKKIIIP